MGIILGLAALGAAWWLFKKAPASSAMNGDDLSTEDAAYARQLAAYQVASRGRGKVSGRDRNALIAYSLHIGLKDQAKKIIKGEPLSEAEVNEAVERLKNRSAE